MENNQNHYSRIAVDIGGTFTDFVLFDESTGCIRLGKRLTTPENLSLGFLSGIRDILNAAGLKPENVLNIIHGTTVASNTVIENKGARTALITTKGFRDVLEIGREVRCDMYDLFLENPKPLVPRYLRQEVTERINNKGEIIKELDEAEFRRVAGDLIDRYGVESFAICFLHAYVNPSHERRAAIILQEEFPQTEVSTSSTVAREIREYERTSTTVINAYLKPLVRGYLETLQKSLKNEGLKGSFYVMLSNGGFSSLKATQDFPVRLIESGPAAGVIAANYFAKTCHLSNIISFDMGGTTAKISLISNGQFTLTREFEVARIQRLTKGSGYPINLPAIELIEIGAGGGSIAKLDEVGLLKVGPESAGSAPGPACYGFGGMHPTVTDANLLLGYLNADYFLGGKMRLDPQAALKSMESLAQVLKIKPLEVASGIFDIVNENMVTATRIHIAESGKDPRKYSLIAFGGAGPIHACEIARKLQLERVICPMGAGVASAIGLLVAPPAMDFVNSYVSRLSQMDWKRLNQIYEEMEDAGKRALVEVGVKLEEIRYERSADMRYTGQGHEISVPIPLGPLSPEKVSVIEKAFWDKYFELFGRMVSHVGIEGVNWRTMAIGPVQDVPLNIEGLKSERAQDPYKGKRKVYFPECKDFIETDVYDRYHLPVDFKKPGPAIIEEHESTIVVIPGSNFYVDQKLNIIIDFQGEATHV